MQKNHTKLNQDMNFFLIRVIGNEHIYWNTKKFQKNICQLIYAIYVPTLAHLTRDWKL